LSSINSDISVDGVVADVTPETVVDLVAGASLILDGTDNFETRFLINDVSIRHGIPWIYAACLSSYGLTMNILPGETACLRCVMDSAPPPGSVPTCDTAGILGPVVAIVAGLQSAEALKYLSGNADSMSRHLVSIDAWTQAMTRLSIPRSGGRRRCETCDGLQFDYLSGRGSRSVTLCGRNAVQVASESRAPVSLPELASRLPAEAGARTTPFLLRFSVVHNQDELSVSVFTDGRAIVTGTVDPAVARSIYARYVGA
jgi:adenylyltransferase/sulfurtransferase